MDKVSKSIPIKAPLGSSSLREEIGICAVRDSIDSIVSTHYPTGSPFFNTTFEWWLICVC